MYLKDGTRLTKAIIQKGGSKNLLRKATLGFSLKRISLQRRKQMNVQ